jgi:hypothetical protein
VDVRQREITAAQIALLRLHRPELAKYVEGALRLAVCR